MAKRKKRKGQTIAGKALGGFFRLVSQGILKAGPVILMGIVGFGIFWSIRENLYADSGFLVQRLEVSPEGAFSRERMGELEKLYLNQNLFTVSPRKVSRQLLQDPRIREARVTRAFPRTLKIEVLDRNTFAEVQLSAQGPYYLIAEDGIVLGVEIGRNPALRFIEAFDSQTPPLVKGKRFNDSGFKEMVALIRAWTRHPLGRSEKIERIRLDHLGNVSLALEKGPELRFGRDPLKKLNTLDSLISLLRGPDRNQIIYIELQYQDLIVKKK